MTLVKKPICLVALCLSIGAVSCGGEEETTEEPVCDTDTNAAPAPPIVSITPSEPTTSEALVAKLVEASVDPDEDPVTPRIKWFKNGEEQTDYESQLEIPADATTKGELWKVEIAGFDGQAEGYPGGAQVTIANTLPTATASLTPEAPTTTEDLVVTLVGEDIDGDQVGGTYAWSKNGAPYVDDDGAAITGSILSSEHTTRGDTWQVIVTPNDGEDDGADIVLSSSIANALPVLDATMIALDPANANADTDLSVTISSLGVSDADGDSVQFSYVWQVDGVTLGDETGSSLSSARFGAGQTVTVSVTPYDGYDYGLAITKSLTIGN